MMHSISKGENCIHFLSAAALRTQLEPLVVMRESLENKSCCRNDDHKHKTCTDKPHSGGEEKEKKKGERMEQYRCCVPAGHLPPPFFFAVKCMHPFPCRRRSLYARHLLTIVSALPAALRQQSQQLLLLGRES